jgi:hypothetical protein
VEVSKLKIPIVIVQGSTDLQVQVKDAELLHAASPGSRYILIEGMNHIFKLAPSDREKNIETYSKPELPILQELIRAICNSVQG